MPVTTANEMFPSGLLKITVVSGTDLMICDQLSSSSDPYIVMEQIDHWQFKHNKKPLKTQYCQKTLNPLWKKAFYIVYGPTDISNNPTIKLTVYDKDFFVDDFMGEAFINLKSMIDKIGDDIVWLKLQSVKQGSIGLNFKLVPNKPNPYLLNQVQKFSNYKDPMLLISFKILKIILTDKTMERCMDSYTKMKYDIVYGFEDRKCLTSNYLSLKDKNNVYQQVVDGDSKIIWMTLYRKHIFPILRVVIELSLVPETIFTSLGRIVFTYNDLLNLSEKNETKFQKVYADFELTGQDPVKNSSNDEVFEIVEQTCSIELQVDLKCLVE